MPAADIAFLLLRRIPANGARRSFVPRDFVRSIAEREYFEPWRAEHTSEARPAHRIVDVLMEGVAFLARAGLIVPAQEQSEFYVVSRAGVAALEHGSLLSTGITAVEAGALLHPRIAHECLRELERGTGGYDTALFKAFREVEIAAREAAGLSQNLVGVDVMNAAFKKNDGPLIDQTMNPGEQDGIRSLFAGAMLALKNPHSHRFVGEDDPRQVMRLLLFASSLLTLVDIASERGEASDAV